jgi:hypothetical protein
MVREGLRQLEVELPLPLLSDEGELSDRDRQLILDAACEFLKARGYRCSHDPNVWSRAFADLASDPTRGVYGCQLEQRDVLLVLCRCSDLPDHLHVHAFVQRRPTNALGAEPALRVFCSRLDGHNKDRLELRHRRDRLKELGELVNLIARGVVGGLAVSIAFFFSRAGVDAKVSAEALLPVVVGVLLLVPHVRYGRDLARLWRWDWRVE